ncbi:hypothetical protein [Methylorubrum extorquens]|uniref:hypothetical protein n=1 Tax=Methylorubrum extorquens TaxID=408 RepID=UPI0020A095D2|nr:hypothetical protein [Methylorubrum extorquens]MCP1540015.1 hypothetical protein [Methylorubrum extorquens]
MLTSLRPGCYGFALSFRAEAPECIACPFAADCEQAGAEQLARRRAELGIVVKEKKPKVMRAPRVAPADGHATAVLTDGLPKKVEELLTRIERAGIRVTEALAKRENPFTASPQFLRVTCHLLLNMQAGIDRKTLKVAFEKKLGWSEGTAAAHATQAFQALTALGAATEQNGRLVLKEAA